MEEIVFWKEVDVKDELPDIKGQPEWINCIFNKDDIKGQWYHPNLHEFHPEITHWLKRVVIKILSDQEIEKLDNNSFEGLMPRFIWKEGYKAMQDKIIGGEGMNYPNIRASEVNTPSNEGSSF